MSKKNIAERKLSFNTRAVHVGQEQADPASGARAVPIYQSTAFVFENCDQAAARFALKEAGNIYTRLTNPTQGVLEERIASLEGGVAALALSSGAAAVTYAFKAVAHQGDHIVSARNIYGGTYNFLKHTFRDFGVETSFVDPYDLSEAEQAIKENTKALYIESLGNPNGDVVDIEAWADLAHKHGLPLIIDNTFATPYLIRPIEYGADIVVHSATKFIGGQGSTMGGIVVDAGRFDWTKGNKWPWLTEPNPSYHGVSFARDTAPAVIATYIRAILLRDEGAAISPFNAWLLLQGTETLPLRVERHGENAVKIAEYLEKHPKVESVSPPSVSKDALQKELYKKYLPSGGGSIFTFNIKGNAETTKKFIDHLALFSLLANVADVKSLVIHPASTTHSESTTEELLKQGIQENTVRLSVGIENVKDLIEDLEEAFKEI
mgnify:FL=1